MERNSSSKQDPIETRLLGFLADHVTQWFTVMELSKEKTISGSPAEILRRITAMERIGLVRSQKKSLGEPWSYQVVSAGKDKASEKQINW